MGFTSEKANQKQSRDRICSPETIPGESWTLNEFGPVWNLIETSRFSSDTRILIRPPPGILGPRSGDSFKTRQSARKGSERVQTGDEVTAVPGHQVSAGFPEQQVHTDFSQTQTCG